MIPDDVQALALADAIGALDPDERREFEDRLATLPIDVRAEVAQLYDAAVEITSTTTGEAPSRDVRAALLARITTSSNHTVKASDGDWIQTPVPGVRMKILAIDRARDRVTMVLRGEPGATYPAHRHSGPEECYVIRGSLYIEGQLLRAGDFHHADGESDHAPLHTDEGVEVLLVAAASDYVPDLT
jgi:anti-sigma factor ChrR (cupin superfamily)